MNKTEKLARRISKILVYLNQGKRLNIDDLASEFDITPRTIQRDFERLSFMEWEECGNGYYKINRNKMGVLSDEDIDRFSLFASISNLFPKIDRDFFQEKLTQSVQIKGFQYEQINHLEKEFNLLKQAIDNHHFVSFKYTKRNPSGQIENKFYQIAPYSLINKNGVWYLIGTDHDKQKTFCFTQITALQRLNNTFTPNNQLLNEIKKNDSISFGNQLSEVIVQVSTFAAPYFTRRKLLPNQELVRKLENGELLLVCKNIHSLDIVPIVQYWIPHLTIISPAELQTEMVKKLQQYIAESK
ncbi:WYL domain-containing protein [Pasteurella skyensis]|uniref:helix-turn-helix transcriptional regulator n=1 Tax=Phocoenobacter skyensis TaxID=97481 RepID=UPI002753B788|nr:WYL domain-containing protein [Pasteurella skyensis]MDP8177469.1 WYL domain-containing protein [Pasteurella skyensis]MDP8200065.1 WYL domain-containing protein [Pasteurella skyensis]